MVKFSYSELTYIEYALTYFCIHECKNMKNIYSDDEISGFRSSVQSVIDKIIDLEEE